MLIGGSIIQVFNDLTPLRRFPKRAHADVEDAIERLLAVLDSADGDPDLKSTSDEEPSLAGAPNDQAQDLELDPAEVEPSLGSTHTINQEITGRPRASKL